MAYNNLLHNHRIRHTIISLFNCRYNISDYINHLDKKIIFYYNLKNDIVNSTNYK